MTLFLCRCVLRCGIIIHFNFPLAFPCIYETRIDMFFLYYHFFVVVVFAIFSIHDDDFFVPFPFLLLLLSKYRNVCVCMDVESVRTCVCVCVYAGAQSTA